MKRYILADMNENTVVSIRRRPDFGGIPGNLALMLALPLITFGLWAAVRLNAGSLFLWRMESEAWKAAAAALKPGWADVAVAFGWIGLQALFQILLPGRRVEGRPLPDGSRLTYRMNGLAAFVISVASFLILVITGIIPPIWLYDHFIALALVITLACYPFCPVSLFLRQEDRSGSSLHGHSHLRLLPGSGA